MLFRLLCKIQCTQGEESLQGDLFGGDFGTFCARNFLHLGGYNQTSTSKVGSYQAKWVNANGFG